MWRVHVIGVLLFGYAAVFGQTHQHGAIATGDGQFNPLIVADNRGGFYLAFIERADNVSNVMLRHSTDGRTFSAPVRVNDRAGDATVRNENPPKVAVAANGDVYVCWANERARWKGNIRFARSRDGGKTFAPARNVNSDAGGEPTGHAFQSIAIDRKGRIYLAWIDERAKQKEDRGAEIWLSISEDGGRTFSRDRRILTDVCECCRTTLQIDTAGRIFISYRSVPRTGLMHRDIIVAHSVDRGRSFTPITVSRDGWELNGCPVAGPTLTVDDADQLTAIWFTGGGARPGLYYATSNDHGASFAARQLLDPEHQLGKHAQAVRLNAGRALIAWDAGAAAQTFSVWGLLDAQRGLTTKSATRAGISYPVLAVNGQQVVMAGLRAATREVVIFTESLTGSREFTAVPK